MASGSAWLYDWSDPNRVVAQTIDSNVWGGRSGHTYTFTRNANGTTDIDYVVVREGKNLKGRFLGIVLGSVGKSRLVKAFNNSVKAIEARNASGACATAVRLVRNLGAGLLAGAIGTAAMDVLLYGRYRRDGGRSRPPPHRLIDTGPHEVRPFRTVETS